ncbi:MAG: LiaF-related protein [Vicinamibacterales bacterium]
MAPDAREPEWVDAVRRAAGLAADAARRAGDPSVGGDVPRSAGVDRRVASLQFVIGLAVIAWGVATALANFGWWTGGVALLRTYWPAALILVGYLRIVQRGGREGGALAGIAWLAVGGLLLLRNLDLLQFRTRDLLPLMWTFAGALMVWRAIAGPRRRRWASGVSRPVDGSSFVQGLAIMGSIERTNPTTAFEGGQITAIMGGYKLDLRQAAMPRGDAVLEVLAIWGGITLLVPPDWTVVNRIVPILGGVDDRTAPPVDARHQLVIRGLALMGGIEVRN